MLNKVLRRLKGFYHNEQGSVMIIFALALIPILGFVGLSVDLGRTYYVNSVLAGAVDAAAIAGGRAGGSQANMTAQATAIYNANIPANLKSSVSVPTISFASNNTAIKVTATGQVNTAFLGILGQNNLSPFVSSVALITTKGAEVVLALDNTGSLGKSGIDKVRTAAQQLVNILYGGNGTSGGSDTVTGLSVAVVPYTTTINISSIPNYTTWLSTAGKQQVQNTNLYPNIASIAGKSVGGKWMGCVEARADYPTSTLTASQIASYGYVNYPAGIDETDKTPSEQPFTPFLYPSTMVHQYVKGKPLQRGTTSTATTALGTPPWGSTGTTRGDNDWKLNGTVPATSLYFGDNYALHSGNSDGNSGVGPNLGCPAPMISLQTSQTIVQNAITNMKDTYRGGTMINLGLNAAWWTISPNWKNVWTQPTPAPVLKNNATLPQAYGDTLKVVVLMTDGQNQWYDWPTGVPGAPASTSANGQGDADYTGYGRLAEGRGGSNLDTSMNNMCTTLKNQGIVIYTVLFNSTAAASLMQNCATDPSYYYYAPDSATLLAAFQNIGQKITNLRLGWYPNH